MIDRLIENVQQLDKFIRFISQHKLPFRATVVDGRPRSYDQNKLQWQWAKEAAEQRKDVSIAEVQCEWKLLFGVPILMAENTLFANVWVRVDAKMNHAEKLELMTYMPVTSMMTVDQLRRYLDEVQRYNAENGIELTDPDEAKHGPKEGTRVVRRNTKHTGSAVGKAKDRRASKGAVS